jgi:sec-independent protein translocase protein TatC
VPKVRRLSAGEEVTLTEHLDELRSRLIIALLALAVAFAVAFWRHGDILDLLNRQLPVQCTTPTAQTAAAVGSQASPSTAPKTATSEQPKKVCARLQPTTFGVAEPFTMAMIVSFWAGMIVALPIVFYQLYAFVIPAFSDDASKRMWPLLIMVPVLFAAGVFFAYEIALPAATKFLLGFDSDRYNTQVRAKDYYSFAAMLLAAMGLIFQVPTAVLLLTKLRILSSRMLRKNRRYAILGLTVAAVALPGVDPITTTFEALPLFVLYEASIWLAWMVERRRPKDARDAEGLPALWR